VATLDGVQAGKEVQKDSETGLLARPHAATLIIVVFSIVYFADVLLRASGKFFWYDELFTVYLCRLPNMHSLWAALADGVDYNPPLFYVFTGICTRLFGEGNISVRLPEVFGYWIFSLCLYRFASQRAGMLAGTIAMLFPMITSAYYYAYEARPHAIVFGFCGLALVCWQLANEAHRSRRAALLGFAAALFGALMMHCYALVILAPFAFAELVRIFRERSIRWDLWVALVAPALLSLFVYVPLLGSYHVVQTTTDFGTVELPGWSQVGHFYHSLWAPCVAIVAAIFVLVLLDFSDRRIVIGPELRSELTLAVSFLLLPVFGVVLAKLAHGPFFNRYFYTAVGGLAILLGIGTARVRNGRSWVALGVATLFVAAIAVNSGRLAVARLRGQGEKLREESADFILETTPGKPLAMQSLVMEDRSGLPIVVVDSFDYLYLAYYAPQLRERLYSVVASSQDFNYFAFVRLKRCCGALANAPETMEEFAHDHDRYLAYGNTNSLTAALLTEPGSFVESRKFRNDRLLLQISRKRD
jgi:hypothetical protein